MRSRLWISGALILAGLVGAAAGFAVGVRVGPWQHALQDSSAKATVLVGELHALRAGKTDQLIRFKELELDQQILLFGRFVDEGHGWLFWPYNQAYEHERYMARVAAYRKEFPAVTPTLEIGDDNPIREELRAHAADVARRTQQVIDTYGK